MWRSIAMSLLLELSVKYTQVTISISDINTFIQSGCFDELSIKLTEIALQKEFQQFRAILLCSNISKWATNHSYSLCGRENTNSKEIFTSKGSIEYSISMGDFELDKTNTFLTRVMRVIMEMELLQTHNVTWDQSKNG